MKNTLLVIIGFLTCILPAQSQILYGTTYSGGNNGLGTISKFITATNTLTVLKTFESLGANPVYTNFIQASDGKLYGMTGQGGASDRGVIFSFDTSSFTYKTLKDFDGTNGSNPYGSLIQASDGKLYGTTRGGGSNNNGVIFSFDPSTSTYAKLKDLGGTDGANPEGSLIQASDGKLYGTALNGGSAGLGAIFSFDPLTSTYAKVKDFDGTFFGANPYGSLIQAGNGKIYGMTSLGGSNNDGVIFYFDPTSPVATFLRLKNFDGTNGSFPRGSLIQGNDGKLYGLAPSGGTNGAGVIFSLDPTSFVYTKLKDFDGGTGSPAGSLMQAGDGKLYGMTSGGGTANAGIIFSYDPSGATFVKLKDFDYTNGGFPSGGLMQASDGKLYGMTSSGGADNLISRGVIFSFDPSSSNYATEDFGSNESGSNASASLLQAINGKLYGMTYEGGTRSLGVIFSLDPSSSTYTKLEDFDGNNGARPYGSLIQTGNGKLYGMTHEGGANGVGAFFSFDPSTSTFTKLRDFDSANGSQPYGSLIRASDGKLYGMTANGGSHNAGVIFSFDPSLATYTKVRDFDGTNGSSPLGNVTEAGDHKLYGLTATGGSNNTGVIFSFDPSSSTYTKLKDFDNIPGETQPGSLIQASDGKLYGMIAEGGSNIDGAIFSFDPASSTYTKVKDFNFFDGQRPMGSLLQASNGKLYGTTYQGGSNSLGVIFSFDPSTSTFEKLIDYDGANGAGPYTGSAFIEDLSGPLPVTLINFTGKNIGNTNQLTWKVGNEQNLDYYELQRSVDGQHFETLSQIKAVGNNSYSYNDRMAASLLYYYRLKSVDKDGRFTYSAVIKIKTGDKGFVVVSPNPFKNKLVVNIESPAQDKAILIITDISGKQFYKQTRVLSPGLNVVGIDETSRLSKGTYLLIVIGSQQTQSIKVVKGD